MKYQFPKSRIKDLSSCDCKEGRINWISFDRKIIGVQCQEGHGKGKEKKFPIFLIKL